MTDASHGEWLAAGTDLMERRRSGVSRGPVRLVVPTAMMRAIVWRADGGADLGASVTIAAIAADPKLQAAYPGLSAAAADLATPEIRQMATVGGNLAQKSRCWYYRSPDIACLKKGGTTCPARTGNHLYGVAFDFGPCVAPHPSTMGMALLAYDARATTDQRPDIALSAVFGDGQDGRRDNALLPAELITGIVLPVPMTGERAVYRRAASRAHAEWPLVELTVRLVMDQSGKIDLARVAVGGVAPVPLRLPDVERILVGQSLADLPRAAAQTAAVAGAKPLPMTGYKVHVLEGLLADALEGLSHQ
jgi:xanthine dehydrogenase YagS FAD-binding subunit